MKHSIAFALSALAMLPGTTLAQEFNQPTFYVWGNRRPENVPADQYLVNMIMLDSYGWFENQFEYTGVNDGVVRDPEDPDATKRYIPYFDLVKQAPRPDKVARRAAWEIIQRLNGLNFRQIDLTPDQICISFNSIGRDFQDCDVDVDERDWMGFPLPNVEGGRYRSVLRFFTELDRLPGLNDNWFDLDEPAPDHYFPIPDQNLDPEKIISPPETDPPVMDSDADPAFWASNRAYRHPFLINAGDPGVGLVHTDPHQPPPAVIPPLRQWMYEFVTEYQRLQVEVYNGTTTPYVLPNPAKFYLDTEPQIVFAGGGRNEVHMLWWIAQRPQYWGTQVPGTGRQVPGYPPGTNLAILYEQARTSGRHTLPASINDLALGLNRNFPAEHQHNRPFMAWWEEICLHTQAEVLKYSVYSQVKFAWPNVKCGNWAEAEMDGGVAPGNTGWIMDWEHPFNPEGQRGLRNVPTQTLPRGNIHPIGEGALLHGVGNEASQKRYLVQSTHRTGDVDSPVLYHLRPGYATAMHRQPNFYRPHVEAGDGCGTPWVPHPPCETKFESSLRLMRHAAESVIESNGGGHENTLVPWIEEAYTTNDGNPDVPDTWTVVEPEELEDLLLMLRGKNTPEVIFWTGYNSGNDNIWLAQAGHAWKVSSSVVHRVYAPRVENYGITIGQDPTGNPPVADPSVLEFTLKEDGQPRVVDVASEPMGEGHAAGIKVVFEGLDPVWLFRVKINLECSVDRPDVQGMVLAWDFANDEFFIVPHTLELVPSVYNFWAPEGVSGWQARVTCNFEPQSGQRFVDDTGRMGLTFLHLSSAEFTSKFDLAQVVGYNGGTGFDDCPTCLAPIPLLKGDANMDGHLTVEDISEFLAKWQSSRLMADTNQDGVVDAADLSKFLLDFVNGL
jgi:hypothetical protein